MTIKFTSTRADFVGSVKSWRSEVAKSAPIEMNRIRSTGEALADLFAASNPRHTVLRFIVARVSTAADKSVRWWTWGRSDEGVYCRADRRMSHYWHA